MSTWQLLITCLSVVLPLVPMILWVRDLEKRVSHLQKQVHEFERQRRLSWEADNERIVRMVQGK